MDEEVMDYQDEERRIEKAKTHADPKRLSVYVFQLGEVMNEDSKVRYWGQDKTIGSNRTCMCVCPACNNAWRTTLVNVVKGTIVSCCGRGKATRC